MEKFINNFYLLTTAGTTESLVNVADNATVLFKGPDQAEAGAKAYLQDALRYREGWIPGSTSESIEAKAVDTLRNGGAVVALSFRNRAHLTTTLQAWFDAAPTK